MVRSIKVQGKKPTNLVNNPIKFIYRFYVDTYTISILVLALDKSISGLTPIASKSKYIVISLMYWLSRFYVERIIYDVF